MSGPKYSYAVTHLESQGLINADAHMFLQKDFYEVKPDVVASVMPQLSIKSGMKAWVDKA